MNIQDYVGKTISSIINQIDILQINFTDHSFLYFDLDNGKLKMGMPIIKGEKE